VLFQDTLSASGRLLFPPFVQREASAFLSDITFSTLPAGALAGTFKAQDVANTLLVYATIRVAPTKSKKSKSESEGESESESETVHFFRWATHVYTGKPRTPVEPASIT
jgi:hypothetical protein